MKNTRIFITGATGLLGSHVLRILLLRGYRDIVALKRPGSNMDLVRSVEGQVRWVTGDVNDIAALEDGMRGAGRVVHCAALISQNPRDRVMMHHVNVQGTANALNVALSLGVAHFLYVSSIAAFKRTGGEQHIDESTEWKRTRYTSIYGYTKHLAEMEVHRARAEGLGTVIINPSIIIGGGPWRRNASLLFWRVWKGTWFCPVGASGFVDVRDVARFILFKLEHPDDGERTIVSGANMPYREMISEISLRLGKRPPLFRLSPVLSELGWRVLAPWRIVTGRPPLLSKDMARVTQCKLIFDNSKSRATGFEYTPFKETLDDICSGFLRSADKNFEPHILPFTGHGPT